MNPGQLDFQKNWSNVCMVENKIEIMLFLYNAAPIHPSTLAVCYEPTWRIFEVRYNGRLWEIVIFLRLTLYKLQKS